jgi:hypothetical protein
MFEPPALSGAEAACSRQRATIGYCGLACVLCANACDPDCRAGGGHDQCVQRTCCVEKGIEGCWECGGFPCDRGFFEDGDDRAWRGICIGSVLCIQECGTAEYLRRVGDRLGDPVKHGDHRYLDPAVVHARLCD